LIAFSTSISDTEENLNKLSVANEVGEDKECPEDQIFVKSEDHDTNSLLSSSGEKL
jgi:hypothetical protein